MGNLNQHKMPQKTCGNKAFSLAEILITLAIVGIIAVLVLQPLIENYEKMETVTKLKKAYTTINQALKLSEAENGDYKNWESASDLGTTEFLNKYWLPYFNKSYKLCTSYSVCGYSSNFPFKTPNGETITWSLVLESYRIPFIAEDGILYNISVQQYDKSNKSDTSSDYIFIDINGAKGPNTFGKDYFAFTRVADKGILPSCYNKSITSINSDCSFSGNNGLCCAEKIRRAGWKIEDDYPW